MLCHLAESRGIWGPFLVVAPASTLHNWDKELSTFTPGFKVSGSRARQVARKESLLLDLLRPALQSTPGGRVMPVKDIVIAVSTDNHVFRAVLVACIKTTL